MKKVLFGGVIGATMMAATVALAFWEHHPHLHAAHQRIEEAIIELRQANDGRIQYGGHRDRAEQMLLDAQKQIHDAAEFADSH
ncbi:MAG TPA: hypothetical protein VMT64_04610 [Candidatus Binataceae bacterium]|nr:hypothetical protein [Candidatus Binataceae bacterium]